MTLRAYVLLRTAELRQVLTSVLCATLSRLSHVSLTFELWFHSWFGITGLDKMPAGLVAAVSQLYCCVTPDLVY